MARSEIRTKDSVSWTIDKPVIKFIKKVANTKKRSDSYVANKYLRSALKEFKKKGDSSDESI